MRCELCDNPATYRVIDVKNGVKTQRNLCQRHAQEEGLSMHLVGSPPLTNLLEKIVMQQAQNLQAGPSNQCDDCGMSYEEFRRTGLLGCPECYEVFGRSLAPLLARAHEEAAEHIGKVPSRAGMDELRHQRLMQLRRELEEAVASEQYERAASLRDQLSNAEAESE